MAAAVGGCSSGTTASKANTTSVSVAALQRVDWATVKFPLTQCASANFPIVLAQPVAYATPAPGTAVAIVVARCEASNPPNAVYVYQAAGAASTPDAVQTLVTEHDFWVATAAPVVSGSGLSITVDGYQPSDPRSNPSVHTVLTWTWEHGAYKETSVEPPHEFSGT